MLATLGTLQSGLSSTPPAWSAPVALTSPLIWCDATELTGYSNGDPVAEFTNLLGSPHFSEATNKPSYLASGINGLACLRGDGSNDNLSLSGLGAQSAWSAAIVFRQHTTDTGENTFWSIADYPSAWAYKMLEKSSGSDASAGLVMNADPSGAAGTAYTSGTALAIIITANGSTMTWADSAGHTSSSSGNHARADDLMRLFRRGDGNYAPADIGEVIFTGAVMTTEEKAALFTYFARWGTSIP